MTDWAIPQQAKLKYTQLFNLHDRSRSGFLSGLQCRDILLQSGLPRNILAEIWNLSDIDGDGQLTREEFILAMHLTNHVRSGLTLPNELPSDLIPPSYRRTRSISTVSVHSTSSVNSAASGNTNDDQLSQKLSDHVSGSFTATSVLSSNSFEDKRRENFEKGRAELERRRLKIIEQQSSVLLEQLAASKKQVTEAKGKIDAMRTERDTKMGLITSLEAQLQTLQSRKTHLHNEELTLIAIAKDLNLVNTAQVELDQLATQAKQKSINQMKEKLQEFKKEKEEKAEELVNVTQRLEESKKELKSLSETVSKTYELYKVKVTFAKEKRQELINENKSKTADLDSAWNSTSFSQPESTPNTFDKQESDFRFDLNSDSCANEDPWAPSTTNQASNINQPSYSTSRENGEPLTNTSSVESTKAREKEFDFDQKQSSFNDFQAQKKYRALYAFEARNPDELTINPGDIIVGLEAVCEPGWLSGESNGRSGLFPEAYVEPYSDTSFETLETNTNDIFDSGSKPSNEIDETAQHVSCDRIRYKAIYAFEARNSDELTINPGDIIIGSKGAHEPGWLMGSFNGQVGLFPEAYVEKMIEEIPLDQHQHISEAGTLQRMSSVGSLRSKKSRSKKAEVATVIANYRALGQEQLNLEKGQLVLIRRKMESGWWEGEVQVKGKKKQFGWFPASYVKLLSSSGS